MKTLLENNGKKNRGGAMLYTIVLVSFAAITVALYLLLVQGEYTSVARSQTWTGSMVLAESGVEDALGMLNKYAGTSTSVSNWVNTAVSADHWDSSSASMGGTNYSVFHMSRTNGNLGYYNVYVTNVVNGDQYTPAILSIGTAYWNVNGPYVGPNSSNTVVVSYSGPVTRKVYVQTVGDSSAAGGLTAYATMNFNGNKSTVDSYNSADPTASYWHTNWFYKGKNFGTYTNTLRTASVVVGTDGLLLNADGVNIYGYVNTGPGGTVSISKGGTVGDLNWIGPDPGSPYHFGIQSGHQRDDMNISFPSVTVPPQALSGLSVPVPTSTNLVIGGVSYPYTKVGGNWGYQIGGVLYSLIITNINGNPGTSTNPIYYQYPSQLGQSVFVDASNVVLYLPNGIKMNSGDNLTLNTNANIAIYSGSDINTGNGLVNNLYQYANALKIYGLSTCSSITFGGNAALTINLYAPSASVQFNGGGSTTYDVCGQIKVNDITVNGHYNFHFDEVLKIVSPPTRYLPAYWEEVY